MSITHRRTTLGLVVLATAMAFGPAPAQANALMSYWSFDDGTDSATATDVAGGRHGTLQNMNPASAWVTGHTGGAGDFALDFTSSAYVRIGQLAELNFDKSTPFSVSVWVYDRDGGTAGVVSAINPDSPCDGWGFVRRSGPQMRFEMSSTDGKKLCITAPSHAANQWVHVTATYDGSDSTDGMKIYTDGLLAATTVDSNAPGGPSPTDKTVAISSYGGQNRYFNGRIDDVAVFEGELTDKQVSALASGASPLAVAPWPAIDISGSFNADTIATDTADSSGTGYRGTLNEKFLAGTQFPGDGILVVPSGEIFELGPYDGDNTVLLDLNDTETIDVADALYSEISILHTAVGFNTISGAPNPTNGTATFFYTDGTSDSLLWDVADNDGNNSQGLSASALTGLTVYRFGGTGGEWGGRRLWHQTFDVDGTKWLDRIEFSTIGVSDPGNDADFGIYAISGLVVPEPATIALVALGLASLAARRRRRN